MTDRPPHKLVSISEGLFAAPDFVEISAKLGITDIETAFDFRKGTDLGKPGLADYRKRSRFEFQPDGRTFFIKKYISPPKMTQIRNWLTHRKRASFAFFDHYPAVELTKQGIGVPRTVMLAADWGFIFEKRSLIITEKIPNADSLERKLPDFGDSGNPNDLEKKRTFIGRLAEFIRNFHRTGWRHRDLYFSHIFLDGNGRFYLIDLARAFRPVYLRRRFTIKDIAQLHYSAPASSFSNTDRLRFYLGYAGRRKLSRGDKAFIRRVLLKTHRMARHNQRHGKEPPFLN